MNEKLNNDITNLKNSIINSDEYKNLQEKNQAIENSDEVKVLSYKKDMAIMEYEDALKHYNKNSKEVLDCESKMSKAIYNLNNHPLVIEYNLAYKELNLIYKEINKELFSFFTNK
jgi:Protein of unknown function (DUF964).